MTRGCGELVEGGVYLQVELSKFGSPLESHLLDPVVPLDVEEMGLSIRQPVLRERPDGRIFIFDIVGEEAYPNIADFLEEVRSQGLSRRCELPASQYNLLQLEQPLIIVFRHAFLNLDALELYYQERFPMTHQLGYNWQYCPTMQDDHEKMKKMINCAGLHWNRVDIGFHQMAGRIVTRSVGDTTYQAAKSPDAVMDLPADDLASAGAVARFTVKKMAVVRSHDGEHEDKLDKLQGCDLPVEVIER